MSAQELETQLKRTVTRGRVLTAAAQLAGYDADALGYKTYRPDAVVLPADADELVRVSLIKTRPLSSTMPTQ